MVRRLLPLVLVASACARPAPVAAPTPPAPPGPTREAPATHVVTIEPGGLATPVAGPFVVTTINPGSDLTLGISANGTCDDVAAWFAYSGGGAAIADGETLCARSGATAPVTHGFSGHGYR